MAVLTRDQLDSIRVQLEASPAGIATGGSAKSLWNAAIQAVEDYFENTARAGINSAVNTATSPTVLSAAQKKAIVVYWLLSKFNRGG